MGGGDTIQIGTGIDLSGFKKGSQKLMSAVSSLGKRIDSIGKTVSKSTSQMVRGFSSMAAPIKRIIPMILGVGSAYQVISKSVNAFLQQNEELSSKMNSIWTALGNVLGPIITQIITWVTTAVSYFLEFLRLLGVTSKSASQLSKNAKAAGSEMKKQLAGFDELNILNDNGGGRGNGTLDDKEAPQWIKDIADFLKKKEWERAGEVLAAKMNEIVNSVRWSEIGERIGEGFDGAIRFLYAAISNFDWKNLGKRFSEAINSFVKKVNWNTFGRLIVQKIIVPIKLLYGFITGLDTKKLGESLSDVILGALQEIQDALEEFDPALLADKIIGFFTGIKVDEIAEAFKNVLVLAINKGLEFFAELRSGINWEEAGANLSSRISELIQDIPWGDIGEELGKWFVSIITGLDGFINGITNDDIKNVKDAIKAFFERIPWGEIGESILGLLGDALKLALKLVWNILGLDDVDALNGAIDSITEAIDGLKKLFSGGGGTWVESLKGIWDVIKEMITATVGTAAELIPTFINEVSSGLNGLPESLYGIVNNLGRLWNESILPMIKATGDSGLVSGILSAISGFVALVDASLGPVVDLLIKFNNDFFGPFVDLCAKATGGLLQGLGETFAELAKFIKGDISFDEMMENLWHIGDYDGKSVAEQFEVVGDAATDLMLSLNDVTGAYASLSAVSVADDDDTISTYATDFSNAMNSFASSFTGQVEGIEEVSDATEAYRQKVEELTEEFAKYASEHPDAFGDMAAQGELQERLTAITQEYIEALRQQGFVIDENGKIVRATVADVEAEAQALEGAAEATGQMADAVGDAALKEEATAQAVTNANAELENTPKTTGDAEEGYEKFAKAAGDTGDTVVTESEEMSEKTVASYDDIVDAAEETNETVTAEFTELGEGIAKSMEENMSTMRDDFMEGTSDLARTVGDETREAVDVFDNNMAIMSNHAYVWGKDLMGNLALGITQGFMMHVGPVMLAVAQGIASYIHFSEPDVGPLAKTHEFMPDMMKLLAEGIEDNIPLAKNAASGIAEAISGEITDGDYALGDDAFSGLESMVNSMSGHAGLINSLSAIADRVAYQMPVVAGGNFLPYSVGSNAGDVATSGQDSPMLGGEFDEILDLLRRIYSAILEGKIIAVDRTQFAQLLVSTLSNEARMRGRDIL